MFLSIMADERSVSEQLIAYLRYVNMQKGEITTHFVGICKIVGHPKVEKLFESLDVLLSQHRVPKEFVVCSTVDGASPMFSARQSVVNR